MTRLLGDDWADKVVLHAEEQATPGVDHYRISGSDGKIHIGGTSQAVILRAVGDVLAENGMDISWNGEQVGEPSDLEIPTTTTYREANVPHRFALNDTDDGYTGVGKTWDDWQRTIDVLALKGINEVFMPVGAEAVYLDTFQKFGYSEQEVLKWIPMPAHQPWFLMQNMASFPSGMTTAIVESRADLGRKIADRLRLLDIEPVLPGYSGTVPNDFAAKNPGAHTLPQGNWAGTSFTRPDWLDPSSSPFTDVAAEFYETSEELFGASTMYKMDLLHEGGVHEIKDKDGNVIDHVDVGAASKAVEKSLQTAHPGATWVLLGWQSNPRAETLASIDPKTTFVVDGLSDRYAGRDGETVFKGFPYAFGSIWNFGGHTTMGANVSIWNERYWAAKAKPNSALQGIAIIPEGSDNNPVALDYLAELAWSDGPTDSLPDWFADWADRRYGGEDPAAQEAWRILGATAYSMPPNKFSEAQDGLFGASPSLTTTRGASWSPTGMQYDADAFEEALDAMLKVDPELRDSSAYRYDLVDVARQVLSNASREWLPEIKTAYETDRAGFDRHTKRWFEAMTLLDQITGTNTDTMLGPWLEDVQSHGVGDDKVALLKDAKSIVTTWDKTGSDVHDYANREWSGLISTYYAPRWKTYFDERAKRPLGTPATVDVGIDWYAVGQKWIDDSTKAFALEPTGDAYEIASKINTFVDTVSFNDATFERSGDTYSIEGGGADVWWATNAYGAYVRNNAVSDRSTVTTHVTSQTDTGPWARAGIVIRNDILGVKSGGYLNLALTPGYGCVLSWDKDGNGDLESQRSDRSFKGSAFLRITRTGDTYTGECKTSGGEWTTVGEPITLPEATARADAGLFMSAVSSTKRGVATFEGFDITSAYLSGRDFVSSTGGFGPWERNTNNGEQGAGDGTPIVLNGTTYENGLGTNSNAEAVFALDGLCTRFEAIVGIDDAMKSTATITRTADVIFEVYADGRRIWESGIVKAGEVPRQIDVDITGAQRLKLVVKDANGSNYFDWADWANAAVTCK